MSQRRCCSKVTPSVYEFVPLNLNVHWDVQSGFELPARLLLTLWKLLMKQQKRRERQLSDEI